MKLIMTEYFQGVGISGQLLPQMTQVHVLEPNKQYEVDDALGVWLLSNRKALEIMEPPTVDDFKEVADLMNNAKITSQPAPEIPVINTTRLETLKRARRAK